MTRSTGDRPWRTKSPQLTDATAAARIRSFGNFEVTVPLLQPQNLRCDENQQLAALVRELVALEEPSEQRHAIEPRRAVLTRLLPTHVDAATPGRLASAAERL